MELIGSEKRSHLQHGRIAYELADAKRTSFECLRLTRWRLSRQSDYCIQIPSTLTLKPLRLTGFTGGVTRPFNVTLVRSTKCVAFKWMAVFPTSSYILLLLDLYQKLLLNRGYIFSCPSNQNHFPEPVRPFIPTDFITSGNIPVAEHNYNTYLIERTFLSRSTNY